MMMTMMLMIPVWGGGGCVAGRSAMIHFGAEASVSFWREEENGGIHNLCAMNTHKAYILQRRKAIFVLKWRNTTCNTFGQHNLCISLEEYTKCTYCNRRTEFVYFTGWRNTRRHLLPHHPVLPRGSQEICRIIVQSKARASQSALSSGKRHSLVFAIQFLRMQ